MQIISNKLDVMYIIQVLYSRIFLFLFRKLYTQYYLLFILRIIYAIVKSSGERLTALLLSAQVVRAVGVVVAFGV